MTDLTIDPAFETARERRKSRSVRTVVVPSFVLSVSSALATLGETVARARARGENVIRLVHGSDDQRAPLRKALRQLTLDGTIQGFIPGEEWAPFQASARDLTREFPALKDNSGFGWRDPRATIVVV